MGFFDDVLTAVLPVAATFLPPAFRAPAQLAIGALGIGSALTEAAAAPVVAAVKPHLQETARQAMKKQSILTKIADPVGLQARRMGTSLGDLVSSPQVLAQIPEGRMARGSTFRRTIVETVDRASGQVIGRVVHAGAPFLMRKDIVTTKRTIKAISDLGKRVPRKTVEPGLSTQITKAVKQKLLSDVQSTAVQVIRTDKC